MGLIEVNNAETEKDFIRVNVMMNNGNPHYIRPLDNEVKDTFNPVKNKNFKNGDAKRWIVKDGNNKLAGRIAAFVYQKYKNKGTEYLTGCIGFFDCVNDQNIANKLFDVAKQWLQSKDAEAMDGPVNFGDRDKWWGLMVEGFDKEPMYGMPFNPPYYEQLFENYGFRNYYNLYYYSMEVDAPLPPRFAERYAKFAAKPGYEARHISMNNLEKHAEEFAIVYNAAWAQHGENKEITKEQVLMQFNAMKFILDERMVWFAYYKDEPIAMFINIPDINQYFKYFNGKMGLLQKAYLVWLKKRKPSKKLMGFAFGVVPKYQALGIDSFMIQECGFLVQHKGWYETYEMGWAGDWNPKMVNIYKSLGAAQSRRMVIYRTIFDGNKIPFERHPLMDYK